MNDFVNIVCSDEVLLQQECCDSIIEQCKKNGVSEREVVDIVEKFSWDELLANSQSLSLFADTKLTDIRFNKSPKKDAQLALIDLLARADRDNCFLIRLPKLDKRQKSTKWFKEISKNGKVHDLWPPKPYAFQDWIRDRAQAQNLNLEHEVVAMLAEQTEGNLLAASQSLEKLKLLFSSEAINSEKLKSVISDNARYSVFLCLDEALAGQGIRAVKMLKKFEQESVAPISILVNMTREINYCTQVAIAVSQGKPGMQALSTGFLWDSKKKAIINAAARLPLGLWQKLIVRCAYLDRMIKGQEKGNIWQELESCLWLLSGKKIWGVKPT
jgi:DNA polymerase III subunit delta